MKIKTYIYIYFILILFISCSSNGEEPTIDDSILPEIRDFAISGINDNSMTISFKVFDNNENVEITYYLNNEIISFESQNIYQSDQLRLIEFTYTNLSENNFYEGRIIVKDIGNNTDEQDFSFNTPTSDTFIGNLTFEYQNEVNSFSENNYTKIIDDLQVLLKEVPCVSGELDIDCNDPITDLSFLNSIEEVDGNIEMSLINYQINNPGPALIGLDNIRTITGNLNLDAVDPSFLFNNLENIAGNLKIEFFVRDGVSHQPESGIFENLTSVNNIVFTQIFGSDYINGFNSITNILGDLELSTVSSSLDNAFENLEKIQGNLNITNYYGSKNIDFLSSLIYLGGDLSISDSNLDNFCGISELLINGTLGGSYDIDNFNFNPTIDDIINGNCSQ